MRKIFEIVGVAALLGTTAWAQSAGGAGPGAAGATPGGGARAVAASPDKLQPPPPASVTTPPFAEGVPPTPAPAFPGLPATSSSGSTASSASSRGSDSPGAKDLRAGGTMSAGQIAQAQTLLQQSGFYHGPLDGVLSGTTRASVRAFQQSSGLPATGQLDAQTAFVLGAISNAPGSPSTTGANRATTTSTNGGASASPATGSSPTGSTNSSGPPFPLSTQPQSSPPQPQPVFIQP